MKDIYLLTDYKNRFGSKHDDIPYRSGMDKNLLQEYFADYGFEVRYMRFSDVNFREMKFKGKYVLYTSSEDVGYHYKSYIEDIVLGLELQGAIVIPAYKYLRANNNKVFMEILRDSSELNAIKNIKSCYLGAYEEVTDKLLELGDAIVIKASEGANSKGVSLAKQKKQLPHMVKRISRTKYLFDEIWDWGRSLRHNGYVRESKYRKKFVLQNFVRGLKNDWKVYVFGNRYYIFFRPILRKNDFRASGGGYDNYLYGEEAPKPEGILDFAKVIYGYFDIPHASLDIAFDGNRFYLLEFQFLYFGTAGILKSNSFYSQEKHKWIKKTAKFDIEKVYVDSIISYIKKIQKMNSSECSALSR